MSGEGSRRGEKKRGNQGAGQKGGNSTGERRFAGMQSINGGRGMGGGAGIGETYKSRGYHERGDAFENEGYESKTTTLQRHVSTVTEKRLAPIRGRQKKKEKKRRRRMHY